METTTNYGLKKPAQEDFVNVEDINYNSDILDEKIAELEETAEGALPAEDYTAEDILEKLKTVDGAGSGLDADLFKGQSVVPVANGGTGQTTSAGINRQVFGSTNNSGVTEFTDYKNLECGTYQFVYSALKENDPFTNPGNKRVSIAVFQGSSVNERAIIAASVDGGETGKAFIGHRTADKVEWRAVVNASALNAVFDSGNVVVPISAGGTGNTTGNAPSAAKLAVARTIQTNLAGTTAASFDGTANITPGVTGVLPISRGGTGSSEGKSGVTFKNMQLNAVNIDEEFNYNYVAAFNDVEGTYGTFPDGIVGEWRQVVNFYSTHFAFQICQYISSSESETDRPATMWTRQRYTPSSDLWSDWRKVMDSYSIKYSTTDLTAGTSTLANGNIYLVYE